MASNTNTNSNNNNNQNGNEAEAEGSSNDYDADQIFSVDHSLIPQAHIDNMVMSNAVVQEVYDAQIFETNVLQQVEAAAEREQRESVATKRRLISEIDHEMKTVTGERLNELSKKRQRLVSSLAETKSVAAVSSVLLDSREENVRMGKATPFGTVVVQESETPTSSFDNFLAGIGTRRLKQKAAHQKKAISSFLDQPSTSGAASSVASPITLHSDMQSVNRLLKHKQLVEEPDFHDDDDGNDNEDERRHKAASPKRKANDAATFVDDADLSVYLRRLRRWEKEDAIFSRKEHATEKDVDPSDHSDKTNEIIVFDDGLRTPARLWRQLYSYQRTAVRWLWELHCQGHGGILADEMGLGKTVEMCAFLFSVRLSRKPDIGSAAVNVRRYVGLGPVLIVCPATILRQWASELHIWAPVFRCVILHNTTGTTSAPLAELLLDVIKSAHQAPPVVITSYGTLLTLGDAMLSVDWHYVILDEGHKIRNPEAKVTVLCKQFATYHRLVISGSPMQNNLRELWCLMDFVYPGKLGSQSEFLQHMAIPIVQGGYANASQIQLQTAYKCAVVLRDTINPYMLRRTKADVKSSVTLPSKTEQVLFCKLTEHQERVYISYLNLTTVKRSIAGETSSQSTVTVLPSAVNTKGTRHRLSGENKGALFATLVRLRHICNHPDLGASGAKGANTQSAAAKWQLSAKMIVVESLLKAWKGQGHRVLLFSQTRTMLDILEEFVNNFGYIYYRMDGETPINQRQTLVRDFNEPNSRVFVFLLTTRVGGLGINLIGANRVIIYDPDWNPTTDTQARERAWRIGQRRDVVIYRLLTSGTIEEKVYHRQIFKQFLTNRVLKDPKQRRFFKVNDIHELFTYTGGGGANRKSENVLRSSLDSTSESHKKKEKNKKSSSAGTSRETTPSLEETAKKRALELAKRLSHKLELAKSSKHALSPAAVVKSEPVERKHHGLIVDGVHVPNAVRLEAAKPSSSTAEFDAERKPTSQSSNDSNNSEHFVLKRLLKCAGVSDSIDFESLVSSRPDSAIIDAEANRVAEAAVQALRKSQQQVTSRLGLMLSSSQQSSKPRFGMVVRQDETATANHQQTQSLVFGSSVNASSSRPANDDLLAVLRRRVAESVPATNSLLDNDDVEDSSSDASDEGETGGANSATHVPGDVDPEVDTLLTDLRAFVAFQASRPGQATSEEIMKAFGKEKRFDDSSFRVFRHLLRRICTFARRPSDGVGLWTLKARFR